MQLGFSPHVQFAVLTVLQPGAAPESTKAHFETFLNALIIAQSKHHPARVSFVKDGQVLFRRLRLCQCRKEEAGASRSDLFRPGFTSKLLVPPP
jgi:hypothetical protein